MSGSPSKGSSALGLPMRELLPPASTIAVPSALGSLSTSVYLPSAHPMEHDLQASENELRRQLNHPRIPGRRDRSERGRSEQAVRSTQRRRVGDVEDLRAKFERLARRQHHPPHHRQIEIAIPG